MIGRIIKSLAPKVQELPSPKPWTHADKIKELPTDQFVSPDYLKSLITNSHKKTDLNEVIRYLKDNSRAGNLDRRELRSLLKKAQDKIDTIDIRALLNHARENGTISFSSIIEKITYFL